MNSFIPDLTRLKIYYENDPDDKDALSSYNKALTWMNTNLDQVLSTQYELMKLSEGAMSYSDIETMSAPDREYMYSRYYNDYLKRVEEMENLKNGG